MAPRPSIKLNGVVLPPHMIAAEAQHHPSQTPAAAFQAAARALIIRTLLLEEGDQRVRIWGNSLQPGLYLVREEKGKGSCAASFVILQ